MEIKQELRPYVPLAQMLVQTLGPDCEVVLHDLDTPAHSVVYVENPSVTGRKVGESFDQLVKQVILSDDLKENFVANYYFTAPNGKHIRSSSLLIKNARRKLNRRDVHQSGHNKALRRALVFAVAAAARTPKNSADGAKRRLRRACVGPD